MENDRSESLNSMEAIEILALYNELGVTETLEEKPVNRFEQQKAKGIESNLKKLDTNLSKTNSLPTQSAQHVATALANKSSTIAQLKSSLATFEFCDLRKGARNLIFGDGNTKAPVMIIGDAPNPAEDRLGKPFVGDEGELLDKMFSAIGLSRHSKDDESIYVSTIIPWKPLHTQSSIKTEAEILLPFIKKHIQLIGPKFLILMGDDPSNALLGRSDRNKSVGAWETFMGIKTLTMRHPKYLIKNPTAKKDAWKDLLLLKEKLHDL